MFWYYVVAIVILLADLAFFYFIIKAAVRAGVRDALQGYSVPSDILRFLKENQPRPLPPLAVPEKPDSFEHVGQDNSAMDEVRLLQGKDSNHWYCTACGAEQRVGRTVCFRCRAKFVNANGQVLSK